MSRSSESPDRSLVRGFTLVEAVVSLLILVVVMLLTVGLLLSMRSFAERQAARTAPRQGAREAIGHLAFFARGASDLNQGGAASSPNAIVTFWTDGGGNLRQASFNGLTAAQEHAGLGVLGTDILSLVVPANPVRIAVSAWGGFNSQGRTSLDYRAGCAVSSARNDALFREATGAHADPAFGGATVSDLLIAMDASGGWGYYRITSYDAAPDCGRAGAAIQVVSDPAARLQVNAPAGPAALAGPVTLVAGLELVSFRVRQDRGGNRNLEQKNGLFDPATDGPGTAFSSVVEDVEDLQVAWVYGQAPRPGSPAIFATASQPFPGAVTHGVPPQGGRGGDASFDVTGIAGLRVSVVARSRPLRLTSLRLTERSAKTRVNFRPAVEDREAGPVDEFDHQRLTTTVMLRSRMPGY